LVAVFALLAFVPSFAHADGSVNFDVEGPSSTIFNQNISVPACTTPNNATSTINGFCAFAAAGLTVDATSSPSSVVVVNAINGITANWQWFLNGNFQSGSVDSYVPQAGDTVLWAAGREPLQVSLSTTTPEVNATTTVTVLGFNPTNSDFEPVSGASIVGTSLITGADGTAAIVATSTNPIIISVSATGSISSQQFTITPTAQVVHQIVLSTSSTTVGQPFTAAAQQYDFSSATFTPLTGITLGVGTLNPDSSFTEIATSTVDLNGQAVFTLNATGTFAVGIKEDGYSTTTAITITDALTPPPAGGGGGISHPSFNIPNALSFISGKQNSDGSFESLPATDWTAIAFAAENPGAAKTKLQNYLLTATPAIPSVLDDARQAMALEAFNINPYSGTSVNYITAITNAFDGSQIGEAGDTDDIFALIALEHAGYASSDSIVQKEASYLLSTQQPDGSWDETPDMTAAAIQALGSLFDINGVNQALGESAGYLASTEMQNGGWGNIDSTAWVQTAINAIIEAQTPGFSTEAPWTTQAGFLPTDALANGQQPDGGAQSADRVLSTSYAITAGSGKSWVTILNSFSKAVSLGGGGSPVTGSGSATATSTPLALTAPEATSTPSSSTSTAPIIVVLPSFGTTTPTTTPVAASKPKPKFHKPQVKTKKIVPAILGESTAVAAGPADSQVQAEIPPASNAGHGLLGSIWHAVASFFHRLF
jgi:hypothetical protein